MANYHSILIDDPRPSVRRVTLNRPEKRNALNNQLRGEILQALEEADRDADVRVSILRGAGVCFSAGYDLGSNNAEGQPYHTAGGAGQWARHVIEGSFRIWDLAKPCPSATRPLVIIASVRRKTGHPQTRNQLTSAASPSMPAEWHGTETREQKSGLTKNQFYC